jgi:hypothetical protein
MQQLGTIEKSKGLSYFTAVTDVAITDRIAEETNSFYYNIAFLTTGAIAPLLRGKILCYPVQF